ncbi:MAG: ATP-binding protein [Pseudomonadota bacterium]
MSATAGDQVRFSIGSSFENVATLAEEVSDLCKNRKVSSPDAIDVLRLCLAEALNNIVEHAYEGAEGRPIFADVRLKSDRYEVMLIDEGKPMPGGKLPDGSCEFDSDELDELPEGGFGWMLIRSQMDTVEYERRDGCNILRLEKTFSA